VRRGRPIRRGAAADACGMRTSGHTRQRVPSRAPTGSRGCPAERLSAAPRQRRYLPDLGGDTCLIWVAELPAAPRQHSGDSTVGRAPSGRPPATAPARSCDLCPQHTHVFRRALGEFGGSGRVPGRDPAPATPGDVSSYDMAVGRGHVIIMQCFDAPASSSVACCQVGQLPTLRHDLQDLHKLCPCLSRECAVWAVDHSHASSLGLTSDERSRHAITRCQHTARVACCTAAIQKAPKTTI
jgi:hypothetical protein